MPMVNQWTDLGRPDNRKIQVAMSQAIILNQNYLDHGYKDPNSQPHLDRPSLLPVEPLDFICQTTTVPYIYREFPYG